MYLSFSGECSGTRFALVFRDPLPDCRVSSMASMPVARGRRQRLARFEGMESDVERG